MTDRAALARPLAAVTTATVDIQVLRIGAKQMTLAVFRQLLRDDDVKGPMWGTVNYHHRDWEGCSRIHRHVVWQRDDMLRHAVLKPARRNDWDKPLAKIEQEMQGWLAADARQAIIDHLNWDELTSLSRKIHSYDGARLWESVLREAFEKALAWQGKAEREEDEERFQTASTLWDESAKLPQLFIAV